MSANVQDGSWLSIITKKGVRYVGRLMNVNSQVYTITLMDVTVCGTEGRAMTQEEEIPRYSDYEIPSMVFNADSIEEVCLLTEPPKDEVRNNTSIPGYEYVKSRPPVMPEVFRDGLDSVYERGRKYKGNKDGYTYKEKNNAVELSEDDNDINVHESKFGNDRRYGVKYDLPKYDYSMYEDINYAKFEDYMLEKELKNLSVTNNELESSESKAPSPSSSRRRTKFNKQKNVQQQQPAEKEKVPQQQFQKLTKAPERQRRDRKKHETPHDITQPLDADEIFNKTYSFSVSHKTETAFDDAKSKKMYYDKNSFFDNISCESKIRSELPTYNYRTRKNQETTLNYQTFGENLDYNRYLYNKKDGGNRRNNVVHNRESKPENRSRKNSQPCNDNKPAKFQPRKSPMP